MESDDSPSPDSTPLDLSPGMEEDTALAGQTVLLKTDPDPDPERSADREAVALAMVTDLTKATGMLPLLHQVSVDCEAEPLHPKKKQRKRPREDEKVCRVCGDKALAHNFDAITCESCKAFFRRNALRPGRTACLFKGDCPITIQTRRFCPTCRLQKCFNVGMKADLILDDTERKARMNKVSENRAKRVVKDKDPSDSQVGSSSSPYTVVKVAPMDSQCMGNGTPASSTTLPTLPTSSASQPVHGQHTGEDSSLSVLQQQHAQQQQQQQQQTLSGALSGRRSHNGMATLHAVLTAAPAFSMTATSSAVNTPTTAAHLRMTSPAQASRSLPASLAGPQGTNSQPQPRHMLPQPATSQAAQDNSWCTSNAQHDFQHVPRDLLPSDPHMYWRLSEEEKTLLTQLSSAYQDTILTLPERVPYEGVGLLQGEAGQAAGYPQSLESIFETSEKNIQQLITFVQRLGDFHMLREDDRIAMLQASGMRSVILRWTALFVVERNTWLTRYGECNTSTVATLFGHEEVIQGMAAFCRGAKILLKNDVTLFVLMHCLILFDPREPNLVDRQLINTFHDKYVILLKHYLESEYSFLYTERYLRAVMDKAVQIRGVADKCMGIMQQFKDYVPPLMKQLLNLQENA